LLTYHDTLYAHRLLQEHGIQHRFCNDRATPHAWDLSWLWPLLTALLEVYRARPESQS
jgi:hypothetical protein